MKNIALAGALALACLSLTGCNLGTALTATDNALASLAKNDIPTACGVIAVAEGYFAEDASMISATLQADEAKAAAVVEPICDNPPTNVGAALATLNSEWSIIENDTKTSP